MRFDGIFCLWHGVWGGLGYLHRYALYGSMGGMGFFGRVRDILQFYLAQA